MDLEKARMTDPEGTDITWTNYNDERMMFLGHEFGKPLNINYGGHADCTGVIAGTLNHTGAFPHIKALLKNDLVVTVEGGGKYGDAWREKIEELNKIEFPELDAAFTPKRGRTYKLLGPGFFWFWEMASRYCSGRFPPKKRGRISHVCELVTRSDAVWLRSQWNRCTYCA